MNSKDGNVNDIHIPGLIFLKKNESLGRVCGSHLAPAAPPSPPGVDATRFLSRLLGHRNCSRDPVDRQGHHCCLSPLCHYLSTAPLCAFSQPVPLRCPNAMPAPSHAHPWLGSRSTVSTSAQTRPHLLPNPLLRLPQTLRGHQNCCYRKASTTLVQPWLSSIQQIIPLADKMFSLFEQFGLLAAATAAASKTESSLRLRGTASSWLRRGAAGKACGFENAKRKSEKT